jgi:hypothetical protein
MQMIGHQIFNKNESQQKVIFDLYESYNLNNKKNIKFLDCLLFT